MFPVASVAGAAHLCVSAFKKNMRLITILLFLVLWPTTSMASGFTFEIEHGGNSFGQSDKKGAITFSGFIEAFRAFPWIDEIGRANASKHGVSPTLSVHNYNNSTTYWVSMAGDSNDYGYLLGIVYEKQKKNWLGLGNPRPVKWVEMYLTKDKKIVEETFGLFFRNEHERLMEDLHKLEKFGESEAKN